MKKAILTFSAALLLFSCQNESGEDFNDPINTNPTAAALNRRSCATQDVYEEQLRANPNLALRRNQIEAFTDAAIAQGRLVNGKVVIPVVVNVLYRTAAENISTTQIQSQIDVLNQDFNAQNSDFNNVPGLFSGVKANVGISFELASVVRKSTTKSSWGTHDAMKKSKQGGINPVDTATKLNLWVCTIGGGILGYAQFPADLPQLTAL